MDRQAEVEARLAVALPIVEAAGRLALAYFRRPIEVENKLGPGVFDPVTAADRDVEALIRERLGLAFPDSAIVGEEDGLTPGGSRSSGQVVRLRLYEIEGFLERKASPGSDRFLEGFHSQRILEHGDRVEADQFLVAGRRADAHTVAVPLAGAVHHRAEVRSTHHR